MVIQEAFIHGRPVICANIGGMAEKVIHGVNGLHFEARNPIDLGDTLMEAATLPGLWDTLQNGIERPISYTECAVEHLKIDARNLGTGRTPPVTVLSTA